MPDQLDPKTLDVLNFQRDSGSVFVARPDGLLDTFQRFPIPGGDSTIMGFNTPLDFVRVLPKEPEESKTFFRGFAHIDTWTHGNWNKVNPEFLINHYNSVTQDYSDIFH